MPELLGKPKGKGLTPEKKKLLAQFSGNASSNIDFNKIKEYEKYAKD